MKNIKSVFPILLFFFYCTCGIARNKNLNSKNLSHQNKETRSTVSYPIRNLVQYAKPIYGTGNDGNTYPGPSLPFGMIQWSPDTGPGKVMAGYNYSDSVIEGFSLDHLNGAGCLYGGNFGFTPIQGDKRLLPPKTRDSYDAKFSHLNEVAKPGYYSVKLDNGIKVELTSTMRSGFGRFIFPSKGSATIMINSSSDVQGTSHSTIHVNSEECSVSGSVVGGHFCRTSEESIIYFYAMFDRPFSSFSTWSNDTLHSNQTDGQGLTSGAFVTFDLSQDRTIFAKVSISYVSVENAKANLEVENPVSKFTLKDFHKGIKDARNTWNKWLNKIQVSGGSKDELETFYSMVYHTLLGPTVCSDVNGQYMGYDEKVHKTENGREQYANFSGWDIYRSESQFLAMIAPKEASDMAQALLIDYRQGGAFPRWGVPNLDSGVMMGDPAAPIISDFYAFGARDFDTKDALAGLVRAATDTTVRAPRTNTYERDALADYLKLGYVPEHQKGGYGNVSMTLEYASADFALSQFAKALGDESDYKLLLNHAQNWKNHFNPETGFLQMRRRDGSWAPGVADSLQIYDNNRAYVEGTAEQYVWMVPFNLKGLAEKMGGLDASAKRLDAFFTKLNAGFKSKYAYMGNEPCSETPWIYDFLGRPYKTQVLVRRIITELFSNNPIAYPGNDDLGQMSSWYIFSALGMYPELPGSDVLVLGSPLFPKVVLHLQDGDVIIKGNGAGKNSPYVQSLKVNGKKWNIPWIKFTDISKGGTMVYKLGTKPNTTWGSKPEDAPPSYSGVK
ncbi:MAG: GH92 family glycosyl hydrolase [Ignavibacteriaceae bacterium]